MVTLPYLDIMLRPISVVSVWTTAIIVKSRELSEFEWSMIVDSRQIEHIISEIVWIFDIHRYIVLCVYQE